MGFPALSATLLLATHPLAGSSYIVIGDNPAPIMATIHVAQSILYSALKHLSYRH